MDDKLAILDANKLQRKQRLNELLLEGMKILQEENADIKEEMKQMKNEQKYFEEETSTKFDETNLEITRMKEDGEKKLKVAENSLRQKIYDGYLNLGNFGRQFKVSIGAETMGNFLRIVGLAQMSKGTTIAYRRYIPKYAKITHGSRITVNGIASWDSTVWHYTNCMDFIDNWLIENELYDIFYSMPTEKEMHIFINEQFKIRSQNYN
jgi:hypothetical protein